MVMRFVGMELFKIAMNVASDENENWFEDDTGRWTAQELWKAAEGLPAKSMQINQIDDPKKVFIEMINGCDGGEGIKYEINRVLNVDTTYPIILNPDGVIVDGYHRLVKAYLDGDTTIKAIRLPKMPESKM